jgi:hypothetical protein
MPNPYGRSGAPMQEPSKDRLRRKIEKLEHVIYVAQSRREQAERRLKEIERILSAPDDRPAQGSDEYRDSYCSVILRAMDAAKAEGGGVRSFELAQRLGERV